MRRRRLCTCLLTAHGIEQHIIQKVERKKENCFPWDPACWLPTQPNCLTQKSPSNYGSCIATKQHIGFFLLIPAECVRK